jgi:hypothetical protein
MFAEVVGKIEGSFSVLRYRDHIYFCILNKNNRSQFHHDNDYIAYC